MPIDLPLQLRVAAILDLTDQIKAYELRSTDGGRLPGFDAGAHIDLEVRPSPFDRETRSYSLVNPDGPADCYRIAVLREDHGTGGSAFMHDDVVEGDVLAASLPKNQFPLVDAGESLLIAGGIGVTPILAMMRALRAQGRRFELHYCARAPEQMAYRDEIAAFAGGDAQFYFDGGDPSRGLDLAALLAEPRPGRHVYVCGPKSMNEAAIALCKSAGWAGDHVHFEFFSEPESMAGDQAFEVELAQTGKTLTVPVGKSILDVMIDAGMDPLYDCTRGECGVCTTPLVAGEADHRDYFLTDDEKSEGEFICICVSRAKGKKLVIDT